MDVEPRQRISCDGASSEIEFPVSGQEYQLPEEIWLGPAYMDALSGLMRFTVPSTGPELYRIVSPAVTAPRSRRNPAVNDRSTGRSASAASIHPVRVSPPPDRFFDHPREARDVPHGGVYLRAAGADLVQAHCIGRVEVARKAGDPAGDSARRRRRRVWWQSLSRIIGT